GQRWLMQYTGNGHYALRSAWSGLALDVFDMGTEDGANIVQWEYWGGEGQQWNINYLD
ncbi:hypothetical protein LCGC14_2263520, partial [marine sediment metagenome]